jgi:hypothetical protein
MGTELIKAVFVRPDGVYLHSKSDNDDLPYRIWKCDGLSDVYKNGGQQGLDREIVRMLCEYAKIQGNHASMERYRPCLLARGHFGVGHANKLDAEYEKLTPEDIAAIHLPEERQTAGAKAYMAFRRIEENRYYTDLAGCAAPLAARLRQNPDLSR